MGFRTAIIIVACVGLFASAFSQEKLTKEDLIGKSESQVLAMGYTKWMELHGKTHGESTAALSGGSMIYAQCLRNRNDALASKSATQKARIDKLRPLMKDFTDQVFHVGYYYSGGGTMWNIFWSGGRVTEEETLYAILTGKGPTVPARVVSDGTGKLDVLSASLTARKADIEMYESEVNTYASAVDALKKARETYAKMMDVAKSLDRKSSDRLIEFCISRTRIPLEVGGTQ